MADYWALSAGNWSNVSNWLTGTTPGAIAGALPGPLDDVYANNRTVTIDINPSVNSIRTTAGPALVGGGFIINNGVTLSAGFILPGTTTCLSFVSGAPNSCTIFANISGTSTTGGGTSTHGVLNNSTGTVNIFGGVLGGSITSSRATLNNSSGIINVLGNVTGGSGTDSVGIRNASTGTINVSGSVAGGSGGGAAGSAAGIHNFGNGLVTIFGDVSGGGPGGNAYGVYNTSVLGNVNIVGNIHNARVSGGSIVGVYNDITSTGTINITGNLFSLNIAGFCVNNNSNTGGTVNIRGDLYGGLTNFAISNNGARAITNIIGNIVGSSTTFATAVINNGGLASTVSITGNVIANNIFNTAAIVNGNTYKTTLTIFGNVSGGPPGWGINNSTIGTITINGNVFGSSGTDRQGIINNGNGTVIVNGTAVGGTGTNAFAVLNNSLGSVTVTRVVGNNFGIGSTGISTSVPALNNTSTFGSCYVEELLCGSRGVFPTSGPNIYITRKSNNQATYVGATSAFIASPISNSFIVSPSSILLYSSISGAPGSLAPLVSDVRFNTIYDLGAQRGTLYIPTTQTVLCGVAVDTGFGSFFTDLPRAWQTQLSAITATNSFGIKTKNIITLSGSRDVWLLTE